MAKHCCERCRHEWAPRIYTSEEPKVCPFCKSPYWHSKRKLLYDWKKTHRKVVKV